MVFTKLENKKIETGGNRLLAGSEDRSGVRARGPTPAGFVAEGGKSGWVRPARPHSAPVLGPSQEPNTSGFNFLIFEFREYHLRQEPNTAGFNFLILMSHEYHVRFSSFSCQNIREYHTKFPNNSMKSSTPNKKICAVFIEIPHW